jgi:indole-3-glycerol phosphate synthase
MDPGTTRRADILERILARKREEVEGMKSRAAELRAGAAGAPPARAFAAALKHPSEVRLLAEIKRCSPSAGWIREDAEVGAIAAAYEAGGAAAVSVLTDREFFGGELDHLRLARQRVSLPVLRKDFVVDALQVWEARGAGADAILLIVRALEDARMRDLLTLSSELGMDTLVEAHTEAEVERALSAGAGLIGVNHRDLGTFTTDVTLSARIAPQLAAEVTLVAESGIRSAADVDRLGDAGVDAVLVGESLMRQPDAGAAAAALCGRAKRAGARR